MKKLTLFAATVLLGACGEKKPASPPKAPELISAADLMPPENVPPPVETQPFEDGFATGNTAGEKAGHIRVARKPPKTPSEADLEVLALEAAGANPDRGAKWQRGFITGYRDGFERIARGLR